MQKTKVVVIHNVVSPHVTKLFQELSKFVDLTVLYCSKSEDNRTWKEKLTGFKYKVLPNFSIKIKSRDLFTYFINPTIFKELNKVNPKVVILAGWDIFAYQAAFFYCKLKGIKVILWSGSTQKESSWRRTLSLPLVKFMIWGSNAYLVYGTRAKEYLIANGARTGVIFNYMHTTDIGKYKRLKKHKVGKEKVILYYGQLIERKGVDVLIKSFSLLKEKIDNLQLLIVGSGQFKGELLNLVQKLNLSKQVNFVEDPGDNKVSAYLSSSGIFVLPSREEVWGLVVNEAMANGLPVVVSNACGSSKDLVQNGVNGYVFKSGSVRDLKIKIELLLRKPTLLNKMGKESFKIIKNWTPLNSAKIMHGAVRLVSTK